ncbi:MAG: HU family DNA-binding protein [Paludibacteraceae bacterium]|nr:HU family DNA-binding protein [Paludibacteraceae bacterium]
MSDEKVNVSDLTDALARRTTITKKNAEAFVAAFQDIFQEGLLRDKNVKITGLGTFRLQWVEPRRSVNVQTGEAIEIAGHYKVVFAPETSLKERVNEPFSHLETTSMDGAPVKKVEVSKEMPLQKLASQAIEIQDILSSINEPEPVVEIQPEPVVETEPEVVKYEALDVPTSVETPSAERRYTPVATVEESKPILNTISSNASMVPAPKKRKLTWLWITLLALLLGGGGFAVYYFYGTMIQTSVMNLVADWQSDKQPKQAIEPAKPVEQVAVAATDSITETPVVETSVFDQPREYTEFIADVRVPDGGRLTLISQKYYGHKDFWVYIYEANKEKIQNPDKVEVGTLVRIPKLNPELINLDNSESLVYARKLHDQYVGLR